MHAKYTHDPGIQQIKETDIAKFLRREMKAPSLVTYRSTFNGSWVAALKADKEMIDIGYLGDGSGKSEEECWLSKKQADYLIDRMTNLITVAEARKRLKKANREKWENVAEVDAELKDAIQRCILTVKNRCGQIAADRVKEAAKRDPVAHIAAQDL